MGRSNGHHQASDRCQTAMIDVAQPKAAGPIIYYHDPSGRPFYSLTPKRTDGGQPYVAVHASEDVSFNLAEAKVDRPSPDRKVKFYRNPMGFPDTSPMPKKDSMGMDYIPVYEGEDSDDNSVKVSPGKIQRTGVKTVSRGQTRYYPHHQGAGRSPARRAAHHGDCAAL